MNAEAMEIYKDILRHPDKDDLRLIYADVLSDAGRDEDADMIRFECRRPNTSSISVENVRAYPQGKSGRFGTVQSLLEMGCQQVKFRRGFVEWVSAPLFVLYEKGGLLVSKYPVTEMTVTDRGPWKAQTTHSNCYSYGWWDYDGYEDPHQEWNDEDLPASVWDLIDKPLDYPQTSWKWFDSPEEAHKALSDALVLKSRRSAGLC